MKQPSANRSSKMVYIAILSVFLPCLINVVILGCLFYVLGTASVAPEVQSNLVMLVGFAAIASVSTGACATFLLLQSLRKRMAVLVENAQRIPKGLPLIQQLQSDDEFSYLDQTLHTTARELRRLEDGRRSLMEMVAHDLRSPLMSCDVSLEILLSGKAGELNAQMLRQVQAVQRNVSRTIQLVTDLLTVDKLEAGKIELKRNDVRLSELVAGCIQSVEGLAGKKTITIENTCADYVVHGDAGRLGQVVINLLSNAIHFSPPGSPIEVASEERDGEVVITVKDNGPGIAFDVQNQLFDKFYQASGKSKLGFGLGLTICKHIVQLHGGTVGVHSEPGKGSRFWFTVPRSERA